MGVYQVALSDTIGVAHPAQVHDVVGEVSRRAPIDRLALHLHDTRGTALVNVYAGLEAGVTTFDAAAGGLGGCPYAPGATGNLATEDLVYMLDGLGDRDRRPPRWHHRGIAADRAARRPPAAFARVSRRAGEQAAAR